jgi:hypothetical protein
LKINEESHFFEIQEENKQGDKISAAYRLYSYFKSHPASELGKKAFLDSLTIFFKEQYFVDATEKGIEFLNYFPKYDKKMDLEKEIIIFNKINEIPSYNLSDGGEGNSGWKHSKESRQKMSYSRSGKSHSENHRKSLSEAQMGKKKFYVWNSFIN